MSIGKKILLGYAFVLALLIIVIVVAIYSLQHSQNTYGALVDVNAQIVERANAMARSTREQVANYRGAVIYLDQRDDFIEQLHISRAAFESALASLHDLTPDAENRTRLAEITELYQRFTSTQERALNLLGSEQVEQELVIASVVTISDRLVNLVDQYRRQQAATVAQVRADLLDESKILTWLMSIIGLIAVISGLTIALTIGRIITRQLQESAGLLSTSAAEILATTSQLATGAAETNTAVNETTTTVEEVKQTAQLASDKARQVLESAQKAVQVAYTGQQSVDAVITGMQDIQTQMEAIAESIVRLSEQSQSIGEIILVVSNLAEQSNLLAVNAAIEATRAGEQGKGFAVVAQEVKSLAEQSRQSTNQVRTILNDIQKATSSAVLATEQGSKAVDLGVKQSTDAGEIFRLLSDAASGSVDAATQIAASSHQQMVGMDQVALAMADIKQASTQNAAGARQAETAAQGLHNLGRKLISLVGAPQNQNK